MRETGNGMARSAPAPGAATFERPQAAIEIEHIHKHHIAAPEAGALRFVPPSAAFHLLM